MQIVNRKYYIGLAFVPCVDVDVNSARTLNEMNCRKSHKYMGDNPCGAVTYGLDIHRVS